MVNCQKDTLTIDRWMPCLRELDVLEVEGSALVRLDALEAAEIAALRVGGLQDETMVMKCSVFSTLIF